MPQRRKVLYKLPIKAKRYKNIVSMMPQHLQVLYKYGLEDHHIGLMECAGSQHLFKDM